MSFVSYPVINLEATGRNIQTLRCRRGMSVKDVQAFFGFDSPQAVYKWQRGQSLPTVDNLLALSRLLEVGMEELLVTTDAHDEPTGSVFFRFFVYHVLHQSCANMTILNDAGRSFASAEATKGLDHRPLETFGVRPLISWSYTEGTSYKLVVSRG